VGRKSATSASSGARSSSSTCGGTSSGCGAGAGASRGASGRTCGSSGGSSRGSGGGRSDRGCRSRGDDCRVSGFICLLLATTCDERECCECCHSKDRAKDVITIYKIEHFDISFMRSLVR
jgi:hypothetical protein